MNNVELASDHYDKHFECYRHWSSDDSAGYHFGIAKSLGDFFDNDKMVENACEMVFSALKLDFSQPVKILDAGCGAGHVSRLLTKKYPDKDIIVYGVTISKKQIELGEKITKDSNLEKKVQLSLNDFEKLPFENNFFDAVFFMDSICHGTGGSKELALRETARVLKSSGRVVVVDGFINPKKGSSFIKKTSKILLDAFGVEEWAVEEEFMNSLEKSGMMNVESKDLTWLSGPSVAQTTYFMFPKVFFLYLRKKLEFKDVVYIFKVAVLAPILGLHPYFKYQLFSATKQKDNLRKTKS